MQIKEVIQVAKSYIEEIYNISEEKISNLGLEEIEYDDSTDKWTITLAFSRPWNTPKTRAAEVLESMGASAGSQRRSFKVLTIRDKDGVVISMKNRPKSESD